MIVTILAVLLCILIALFSFLFLRLKSGRDANEEVLKMLSDGEVEKAIKLLNSKGDKANQGFIGALPNFFFKICESVTSSLSTLKDSNQALSDSTENVAEGIEHLYKEASLVADSNTKVSDSMQAVTAAMEQSSSNVATIATASEEMTATINDIASNTKESSSISREAVAETERASVSVNKLGQVAQEISKITEAINEISEQTNLLALNATIEAARAGESGKGFAVVANEIKELANQTSLATQEIRVQVSGIQNSTSETIDAIDKISTTIASVNDITRTIETSMEQQVFASEEISQNISEVSTGIQNVNYNISTAVAASDEMDGRMSSISAGLDDAFNHCFGLNQYAKENDQFIKKISKDIGKIKIGKPKFDIGAAKVAHLQWKINLDAVLSGRKKMGVDEVVDHHQCAFGKWYDSVRGDLAREKTFKELIAPHKDVHAYAKKVIASYNDNNMKQAKENLAKFEVARTKMFELLDELYLTEK